MKFGVALTTSVSPAVTASAQGDYVRPRTGTVDDIVDDLRRYEEAGLEYLVLSIAATDTESTIEGLHRFADEIAPRV